MIEFDRGVPTSIIYNDLYFSRDGGLEEAKYVFLDGNDLNHKFVSCLDNTIVELGFGTGLNFLATFALWIRQRTTGGSLQYVGIEKFPLLSKQILECISGWEELHPVLRILLEQYPQNPQSGKIYEIDLKEYGVTLTLILKDIKEAMALLPETVDAWFLDGFAPKRNPDMWTEEIFAKMADLSNSGGTFATFTAASAVRRGLENVGFNVSKQKGFGRKREMLIGKFIG